MTADTQPSYRPDIDGLRAVAVLSVLLFHAFPQWFPGGFIGVDIFFVISGYLISSIIFRKLLVDDFSFVEFYIHRIRRIFPALIVVLTTAFGFGWIALSADEFKQFGQHMGYGVLFAENLRLYDEFGYFDLASELKPLMHLWSLAIEEQFYLLFPPTIWLLWRVGRRLLAAIIGLAALSFVANLLLTRNDPTGAFFFYFSRAWELLAGVLLAHAEIFNASWRRALPWLDRRPAAARLGVGSSTALSGAWLLGLVSLILFWDKAWAFPGVAALLPVGFALAALTAGRHLAGRGNLLGLRPFVAIGLISYPLYLWHWPILSFLHILKGAGDSFAFRAWACVASVALAWATFAWIERPLRYGGEARNKALALCGTMALLAVVGFGGYRLDGWTSRPVARELAAIPRGKVKFSLPHVRKDCALTAREAEKFAFCASDDRGEPSVALIGDSKASVLAPALFAASSAGTRWTFIGGSTDSGAMLPVLTDTPAFRKYQAQAALVIDRLAASRSVKTVVVTIAARNLFHLANDYSLDDLPASALYGPALEGFDKALSQLIASGKKIVVTVDNPTLPDPKQCMARRTEVDALNRFLGLDEPPKCAVALDRFMDQSRPYRTLLAEIKARHPDDVALFDATDLFCDAGRRLCEPTLDGVPLYSFTDHISGFAATKLAARLVPQVEGLAAGH